MDVATGSVTTRRDRDARPAPDLVDRNFMSYTLDRLPEGDITLVPRLASPLYLPVVLDAWSRRIVGWFVGNAQSIRIRTGYGRSRRSYVELERLTLRSCSTAHDENVANLIGETDRDG